MQYYNVKMRKWVVQVFKQSHKSFLHVFALNMHGVKYAAMKLLNAW